MLVLLALLLIASKLPIAGNYQIKIVLSGSMEPAIKTGSIVVIKPADSYRIGDIITFGPDNKKNIPISHRIVETRVINGETRFLTKGDANKQPDIAEVKVSAVIGKVILSVPYFGYLLDMARKPLGMIILIGVPAVVIIFDEGHKIWREMKKMRQKKDETNDTI